MLSVLIPVFNEDIRNLVNDLNNQLVELGFIFEIRVYDDGSHENIRDLNKEIASNDSIIYEELPKNIGRSAIRNKLAKEAKR